MDAQQRKKINVIAKYAEASFSQSDWYSLGQLTESLELVETHPRLLRSLDFGDADYASCAVDVLNQIFEKSPEAIDEVIDHYDIDVWYEQAHPIKFGKLFLGRNTQPPDFWRDGDVKAFVSHLSSNRRRASQLKSFLSQWGISAFIAHDDIEPSREWQREIEVALETMDLMVAIVEPGFRESAWCSQEVGYALGRKVEVIPVRAGLDPFGLFGKYQGIQAKTRLSSEVAQDVVKLLLRKPKYRTQLLLSMSKSMTSLPPTEKATRVRLLDSWSIVSDQDTKVLLERISLSESEKVQLREIIERVTAFEQATPPVPQTDDIPF